MCIERAARKFGEKQFHVGSIHDNRQKQVFPADCQRHLPSAAEPDLFDSAFYPAFPDRRIHGIGHAVREQFQKNFRKRRKGGYISRPACGSDVDSDRMSSPPEQAVLYCMPLSGN